MAANVEGHCFVCHTMHLDHAGGEIDRPGDRLVNAADIQRQLAVYEHPQIIVPGEFVNDIMLIPVLVLHLPVLRDLKVDRHAHAEVMVQVRIKVHLRLRFTGIVFMEREEADGLGVGPVGASGILGVGMLI